MSIRRRRWLLGLLGVVLIPGPADAQTYKRFDVPDSLLVDAVAASRGEYEAAWNALLIAELRATASRADSARRLSALERRVAGAETEARGTRIASEALALRARWSAAQRSVRVRAALRESLAIAAQGQRRWPEADSLFRRALPDYVAIGERRREAWVLGSIGVVAFSSGNVAGADSVYQLALVARRRIADPTMIGNTLNSLGSTNYVLGRHQVARGYLEEAREVREKNGERGPLGATLNSLGLALIALGQPDSARLVFARALELTVAAGDSGRTADVLVNTMSLLVDAGEVRRALELGGRAAVIFQELGNPGAEAGLHLQLGDLRRVQGRFAEAVEEFETAVSLARDANDPRRLLNALVSLGRVHLLLGDADNGRPPLVEAVRLADSLGFAAQHAGALNNLALFADAEGDLAEADRLAATALEKAREAQDSGLEHEVATTLGAIATSRGDAAGMLRWYGAAAADSLVSAEERCSDLNNLAIAALSGGDPDRSKALFEQAAAISKQAQVPDLMWPPLLGLGEVAERQSDFSRALAFARQAVTMIDTLRTRQGEEDVSITVLAERRFATEALIHLLTRLQSRFPDSAYVAEAFTWAERARARALAERVQGRAGKPGGTFADLARARAELGDKRTAFLEYSLGDSSSSLWVITQRGTRHFRLPPRAQLRGRVEILRRSFADPSTAETAAASRAARALYRQLIEPAEPMLKGVEHLVVSPEGSLAMLPFEALLQQDVASGAPPPSAYLISRFTVSYVPSATIYAALAGRRSQGGIVALGNPAFRLAAAETPPARELAPLPHTAEELSVLQQLSGGRPIQVLSDTNATRDRLLGAPDLPGAAILHLATHGEASEYERRQAGLWLAAGEDGEPGFLSVEDVLKLRLAADLVTLSACETGLGRVARGEGVLGLPRAFLACGAHSVLVSLWKVSDQSTATLMQGFYQELLSRSKSGPMALALAKRRMLASAETRSPFHWAPFILSGRYPDSKR